MRFPHSSRPPEVSESVSFSDSPRARPLLLQRLHAFERVPFSGEKDSTAGRNSVRARISLLVEAAIRIRRLPAKAMLASGCRKNLQSFGQQKPRNEHLCAGTPTG